MKAKTGGPCVGQWLITAYQIAWFFAIFFPYATKHADSLWRELSVGEAWVQGGDDRVHDWPSDLVIESMRCHSESDVGADWATWELIGVYPTLTSSEVTIWKSAE